LIGPERVPKLLAVAGVLSVSAIDRSLKNKDGSMAAMLIWALLTSD
jgi:hypothetical protein